MHTRQRHAPAGQLRHGQRKERWTKRRRYDEAAALADEIVFGCGFGTTTDRNVWAARFYEYPWALAAIRETAYLYASCQRQGLLRDAVTAFQAWLNKNCPGPARQGGGR